MFRLVNTVNVLKFQTQLATKRSRQTRKTQIRLFLSLIRVFTVCYSDMHFMYSSLITNTLFKTERESVQNLNFRALTVTK